LGLTAGLVPSRVDEHVKAGLLDLVDHVVEHGLSNTPTPPFPAKAPG
jgi:hypothetical protein